MKYEWLATRHAKIIDKDSKFSAFSMPTSLHGHLPYEETNLKQIFLRLQF